MARAAETLCGFLNGHGGSVPIGVAPDGKIAGQMVSDGTLRDVAEVLKRLAPPVSVQIHRVGIPDSAQEVLVLGVVIESHLHLPS